MPESNDPGRLVRSRSHETVQALQGLRLQIDAVDRELLACSTAEPP